MCSVQVSAVVRFYPPIFFFSRHFADKNSLDKHLVSKLHKKRMKVLKEKPYTLEEARAAGGEGTSAFYAAASSAMAL